jgi:DNA-directed RNA polymerase subunit RPC12/RpoP
MGLYVIPCRQCGKKFIWFSGNNDPRCDQCRYLSKEQSNDRREHVPAERRAPENDR